MSGAFKKTLGQGANGSEVMKLQQILIAKGMGAAAKTLGKTGANGYFGPATKKAVMEFQKMNGLEQTGSLGPKTRALLNSGM